VLTFLMDAGFVYQCYQNHITVISSVTKITGKGYQGFVYVTLHFYLSYFF